MGGSNLLALVICRIGDASDARFCQNALNQRRGTVVQSATQAKVDCHAGAVTSDFATGITYHKPAMADPQNTALTPFYYRDNFLQLCDTVEAQYGDLLQGSELSMLQRFRTLEFKAQCLYIRLVSRVGPWFRESKLAYPELGTLGPLLDQLLEQGMALTPRTLVPLELGKLYTRDELQKAFADCLPNRRCTDKGSLLAAIDALSLDATASLQRLAAFEPGRVVAPAGTDTVQLLQLLFFGNRRQSLTDFVLSDLGVSRYYPYPLDRDHRLFPQRQALEEYLQCAALSDRWYELRQNPQLQVEELAALAADMLALSINYPSSEGRWHRLCNDVARNLERHGELDTALQLYRCSRRHPARERRARILERRENWAACAALCDQILATPWCEDEREAARRILPRVQRKLDGSRLPRARDAFSRADLLLPVGSGPVELQAAAHLQTNWQAVHYVENKLMNALFGLAFWEQIFAPVPGAFHNPYQSVPADMYDPEFSARRGAEMDTRLQQLRQHDLPSLLGEAYRAYAPFQCRWVDWRRIDANLVDTAARIIPRAHLLAIWERMLFDPGENRRGFPDLIALGEATGDYCLVEIKAPGDALQDSQKRWLRYFATRDIPAQVAWVTWDE